MSLVRPAVRRFLPLLVPLLLAACGGGGGSTTSSTSSPTLLGSFVDAPVQGLVYTASPSGLTGTTDATGSFNFKTGDTVTFKAAGVSLGTASPAVATDGSAVVTPLTITGETAATSTASAPKALAIATFLNALNTAAIAKNGAATVSGAFVIPSSLDLSASLGSTNIQTAAAATVTAAINTAAGTSITAPATNDVLQGLQQGVGSVGFAGTVWRGTCGGTCGGGTVFFRPNGEAVGLTDDGGMVSGSWVVTPSTGDVNVTLVSSSGGSATGTIAKGASSGTLTLTQDSGGTVSLAVSRLTSASSSSQSSPYYGIWYVTFTPNAAAIAAGNNGGKGVILAAPNGSVYGLTDSGNYISGSWTPSSGVGTATAPNGQGGTISASFDLSAGTGSVSINSTASGTLAFARTGSFNIVKSGNGIGGDLLPLLLNLTVSWPNTATGASSIALDAHVDDSSGNRIGSAVKPEITAIRTDGKRTQTTDNISVSYPKGKGATYKVTFGGGATTMNNCSISGGSGTVSDANSGKAGAYGTVTVTCN